MNDHIKTFLREYQGRPLRLMEVCGTHTAEISRSGIPGMLSSHIHLIPGPVSYTHLGTNSHSYHYLRRGHLGVNLLDYRFVLGVDAASNEQNISVFGVASINYAKPLYIVHRCETG